MAENIVNKGFEMRCTNVAAEFAIQNSVLYFSSIHSKLAGELGRVRDVSI